MAKINRVGQVFQQKQCEGVGKIEVVDKIDGRHCWIIKITVRDLLNGRFAVDGNGYYGDGSNSLGDEIVPIKVRVGGFYVAQDGEKIVILKPHPSIEGGFSGVLVGNPSYGFVSFDREGKEIGSGHYCGPLIKEITP